MGVLDKENSRQRFIFEHNIGKQERKKIGFFSDNQKKVSLSFVF